MTEKRDAAKDRAMCDAASPEPWEASGEALMVIVRRPGQPPIMGIVGEQTGDMGDKWGRDARFIATARTALPHWIDRATAAEAALRELRDRAAAHMAQDDVHSAIALSSAITAADEVLGEPTVEK